MAQAPPNRGTPIDIYKENYQSPPAGDGEILHGLRQEKEQSSDVFAAKLCRDAYDALGTDKADSLMNLIEEKVRVGRVRFPGGYLRALLDRHHAGHSRLPMMTPSARSTPLRLLSSTPVSSSPPPEPPHIDPDTLTPPTRDQNAAWRRVKYQLASQIRSLFSTPNTGIGAFTLAGITEDGHVILLTSTKHEYPRSSGRH